MLKKQSILLFSSSAVKNTIKRHKICGSSCLAWMLWLYRFWTW